MKTLTLSCGAEFTSDGSVVKVRLTNTAGLEIHETFDDNGNIAPPEPILAACATFCILSPKDFRLLGYFLIDVADELEDDE